MRATTYMYVWLGFHTFRTCNRFSFILTPAVLEFEHKGWQSKQCELFADIFSEAIRNGLPAIQTQHPGLYYQQAAQHAIARRELAEELCASESAPKVDRGSTFRIIGHDQLTN